jgi:putative acyl-CoA dehydrogenase
MRLARAYDQGGEDERETLFKRLATAVSKYWICKRAPAHAAEALECFGGNGYVEESDMPRLYRESPLNSIWEGSGNVICLDVLRAMVKSPESVQVFFDEVSETAPAEPAVAESVKRLKADLSDFEGIEARARSIVERMALTLQAALLVRDGDPAVADAFCASRLRGDWGRAFGTLPAGVDAARIIARHTPRPAHA